MSRNFWGAEAAAHRRPYTRLLRHRPSGGAPPRRQAPLNQGGHLPPAPSPTP